MKKLYIIRHGKSDWGNPEVNDFNRPLNHRGLKDAPRVGKHLLTSYEKADTIISSPAKRAITTAKLIANEINYPDSSIIENENIYLASKETILQIINKIDDQFNNSQSQFNEEIKYKIECLIDLKQIEALNLQ